MDSVSLDAIWRVLVHLPLVVCNILCSVDIESGEMNNISMGENRQTSVADRLLEEKNLTVNSELVDGQTSGVVKEVLDNQTVKGALEKLDDLTGAIEQGDFFFFELLAVRYGMLTLDKFFEFQ